MQTENILPKSKVSYTKHRGLAAIIVITAAILILISIWMQNAETPQSELKKPIVTASQANTRIRIDHQHAQVIPESQEAVAEPEMIKEAPASQNGLQNVALFKDSKIDLLTDLQEKINQQEIRLRQAAAQKKLVAPSAVYQMKQTDNLATTNPLAELPLTQLLGANNQFANAATNQPVMSMTAAQQETTDLKIFQGKVIPGVLDTAVNSDLPGMIRATISEDVYGETGKKILLPRGTRLIGQYNSAVATGQVRVYVIWTRAITPQQIDIRLASPGVDNLGRSGLDGSIDNHFWDIFGTSLLLSVMAAGVADMETHNSDSFYGNPYQNEVVESFTDNSDEILANRMEIKPTISINQGTPMKIMVAHDLDFSNLPAHIN
jgi:type IV secretory pathway VirB10-like protein